MRPTTDIAPEDTLERAASELLRNGCGLLPVVQHGILRGVVTDASLARALIDAIPHLEPAERAAISAETIAPYATAAEALRRLADGDGLPLVVVDDFGRPMGIIAAADLYPRRRSLPRPGVVGGMATPFGVYLTNGAIPAGARGLPLVTTGILLSTLLILANLALNPMGAWLEKLGMHETPAYVVASVLSLAVFFAVMRILPLAGTHGAEHMVVHAIERGEELTPSVVRRMPRVHPRCGTNIAVGALLFTFIYTTPWVSSEGIRLVVAGLTARMLWVPLGSWMQQYVTTRRPTEKQIQSGIDAANELLEKYSQARVAAPTIPQRLWNSGLFHIFAGSALVTFVVWGLSQIFGWNIA
ncbi:metal-dependent enzyme-like protein [Fimbriimonas ginsengisoli Gsoil 348]|uniref:Metal-dependent enzyme-like protein n=2 Tax=Fimbriimonas ginsengisoli TaxID=1005039 RepID=A0A068NXG3_FIMGI|nr:metal-dependent enzyme-like protein [Fimbriimonas ginsengisoli Gsoil 348]